MAAGRNKTSKPAMVDVNVDGQADLVYVADLMGTMYRIDVSGNYNPDNWEIDRLYVGDQEIQADPVAAHGPNGEVFVYFGTGAYLEDEDMTSHPQNSFLCVFDRHNGSSATKNQMADQTDDIEEVGGHMGWYVNLWNEESERVTQKAAVVAETVIFTSYAPNEDECVAGGTSLGVPDEVRGRRDPRRGLHGGRRRPGPEPRGRNRLPSGGRPFRRYGRCPVQ